MNKGKKEVLGKVKSSRAHDPRSGGRQVGEPPGSSLQTPRPLGQSLQAARN